MNYNNEDILQFLAQNGYEVTDSRVVDELKMFYLVNPVKFIEEYNISNAELQEGENIIICDLNKLKNEKDIKRYPDALILVDESDFNIISSTQGYLRECRSMIGTRPDKFNLSKKWRAFVGQKSINVSPEYDSEGYQLVRCGDAWIRVGETYQDYENRIRKHLEEVMFGKSNQSESPTK